MNSKINIMRIFVIFLVTVLLLAGCISAPTQVQTPERIKTVVVLQDVTATPFSTHSPTHTPTLEPTSILISRTDYSGDGVEEIYSCVHGFDTYKFALYQNGRLIVFNSGYFEARVSQSEIDKLLSDIKATGFFSLNGDDDTYINSAPTSQSGGGWGSDIVVQGKRINFYGDISPDYEVDAIKKTKRLLDDFEPSSLEPYKPDSILVWVTAIDNPSFDNYYPQPSPPLLHWSADAIQLNTIAISTVKVISGSSLDFVMRQIKTIPDYRIVEQNGQYYLVAACPNFDNFK